MQALRCGARPASDCTEAARNPRGAAARPAGKSRQTRPCNSDESDSLVPALVLVRAPARTSPVPPAPACPKPPAPLRSGSRIKLCTKTRTAARPIRLFAFVRQDGDSFSSVSPFLQLPVFFSFMHALHGGNIKNWYKLYTSIHYNLSHRQMQDGRRGNCANHGSPARHKRIPRLTAGDFLLFTGAARGHGFPASGPGSNTGCQCSRRCGGRRSSWTGRCCRTAGRPRSACRPRLP